MLLSVIIVNYNVRYFLEQCLHSVQKATAYLTGGDSAGQVEVLVVDNCSIDGSLDYLTPLFPGVEFIRNIDNTGFAKANNQALARATGEYILFLNPDTILPGDCFFNCISYLSGQEQAGALGVRMVDGCGQYLKESKRGFPSPWVSFCKMTGLTALFPHSSRLARYYMGHLDEKKSHVVDALAGAFMLVRKKVLDETGGFDERFFMYAEDIDLSYRIQQAGYRNHYFSGATIIHFKGESTRKDHRYIKRFYKAMIQFVRKHRLGKGTFLTVPLLSLAIRCRAGIALLTGLFYRAAAPQSFAGQALLLTGDMAGCTRLKDRLVTAAHQGPVVKEIVRMPVFDTTRYIVYCEGKQCSFKEIIRQLEAVPMQKALIHAAHSSSVAGSFSKDQRGVVFALEMEKN